MWEWVATHQENTILDGHNTSRSNENYSYKSIDV